MRNLIAVALIAFAATTSVATADILDDNVAKAARSVENANKKLATAQACVKDDIARQICKSEMLAKAEKSLANAQKKLAAIQN